MQLWRRTESIQAERISYRTLFKLMITGALITHFVIGLISIPYVLYIQDPSEYIGNAIVETIANGLDADPNGTIDISIEKYAGPGLLDIFGFLLGFPFVILFAIWGWLVIVPGLWVYSKFRDMRLSFCPTREHSGSLEERTWQVAPVRRLCRC